MAEIEDDPENFSRCSFGPAEINHDFKGLFNENQDHCFNSNTICTNDQLVKKYRCKVGDRTGARRKSGAGDDDLISQIFFKYNPSSHPNPADPTFNSVRYNKTDLKSLQDGEYDIYCLTGKGDYKVPFINGDSRLQESEYTRCKIYKKVVNAKPYPKDCSNIAVFKYPYENFLLIDAVPFFVTSILKSLKFPECNPNMPNLSQEEQEEQEGQKEITMITPDFTATNWPFRPKINIINSATTLGDGAPCTKPNAPAFNINKMLKLPNGTVVPRSNDDIIPGGEMGVPLIYSWYYSKSEISNPNNTFMMSNYEIVTAAATTSTIGYTQQQFWNIPHPHSGITLEDANKRNRIPGIVTELKQQNLIPNKTSGKAENLTSANCEKVNLFLQRKRSGDYLQIKSTYDFPRHAVENKDYSYIYQLKKGPSHAESNTNTRLHKAGSLKDIDIEGATDWKNEEWYKKRTYFVTGDWPAFCYATYNKINCIITCKRGGGEEGSGKMGGCSGLPIEHIIFRNFFD